MKKILILEANPSHNLSLNDEIRDLQSVIDKSSNREEFRIDIGLSVKSDHLQNLMQRYEPNIVHFCGHGEGQDGLVFQDKKIDTDTISSLFALCREHLQCVVLNACYSEVQADEINKHIKYVIGMNQAIRDDAAIAFSIGFYRALAFGKSVEDAFKWGKNAIQLALTDGSISRDRKKTEIDERMRKLIPIGEVPEDNIAEHLKPTLKVNSNIVISSGHTKVIDTAKILQIKMLRKKNALLSKQYLAISEKSMKLLDPGDKVLLEEQADDILEQIKNIDNSLTKLNQ